MNSLAQDFISSGPFKQWQETLVGVGYRFPFKDWIQTHPKGIECLEITAEHFYDSDYETLHELGIHYPTFVHGLGLSLGTPGPIDKTELNKFNKVVQQLSPEWISEHVAFTKTKEVDLGHLNPIRPDSKTLDIIVDHAREVSDHCGKPLILENVTSHVKLSGDMSEPEFMNRICDKAGCGLLLDVTNLFINACNHHFDTLKWLHQLNPAYIIQLHVVGYLKRDGLWIDSHGTFIQDDLWDLIREVVTYASVRAIIIERDAHFPEPSAMIRELQKLKDVVTSS